MLPMSWVTRSARSIFSASSTPATSPACVFLSKPPAGLDERPMPAQVRHDDGVIARKIGRHRRPHVAGLAIAVQQDDSRPAAAGAHMDRGAVGRDVLRAEPRRKREVVQGNLRSVHSSCGFRRHSAKSSQVGEELVDLARQRLGLLQRGEVAALRHHAPAADVGVGPARPASAAGAGSPWGTRRSPSARRRSRPRGSARARACARSRARTTSRSRR